MSTITEKIRYDQKGNVISRTKVSEGLEIRDTSNITTDENGNITRIEVNSTSIDVHNPNRSTQSKNVKEFEYQKVEDTWVVTKITVDGLVDSEVFFEDFGTERGICKENYKKIMYIYSDPKTPEDKKELINTKTLIDYTDKDGTRFVTEIDKPRDLPERSVVKEYDPTGRLIETSTIIYDTDINRSYYTISRIEKDEEYSKVCESDAGELYVETIKEYEMDDEDKVYNEKTYKATEAVELKTPDGVIETYFKEFDKDGKLINRGLHKEFKKNIYGKYSNVTRIYTAKNIDDERSEYDMTGYVEYFPELQARSFYTKIGEISYKTRYSFKKLSNDKIVVESLKQEDQNGTTTTTYLYYNTGEIAMITNEFKDQDRESTNHIIYEYDSEGNPVLEVSEDYIKHNIFDNDKRVLTIMNTNYPISKEVFDYYYNKLLTSDDLEE